MEHINRSKVLVNLKSVSGQTISDHVELKFYNQRASSLNQSFKATFKGKPLTLSNVPAVPFGLAEVFISPANYRFKRIFLNVPAGKQGTIDETFFIEPSKVKPVFPSFSEIQSRERWKELWRILSDSGVKTAAAWKEHTEVQRAGLLNLTAKMGREVTGDQERSVICFVQRITKFLPERIYAIVEESLLQAVAGYPQGFHAVSGALHEFPGDWKPVSPNGSFKTHDRAGNLQLTFAKNNHGEFMADIDIDDHQGIEHAADVLKHKITGKDTHPYDIHDILVYFQGLDPGYDLA